MKIIECVPLKDWLLRITSEEGKQGLFDIKPYLKDEAFLPLQQNEEFLKISNGGYFVEWDCGADLSADTLEAKWFDVIDLHRKVV